MASTEYTVYDQAADLGIHRVHSLALGDPRKEARIMAKALATSPAARRAVLGRGDARQDEWEQQRQAKRELDKIARRHNLRTDGTDAFDDDTLTSKIAAWGNLKVENVIRRPDGLGTGNVHRTGPNYRPIASFGQPRRPLPPPPRSSKNLNLPGTSAFAARRPLPAAMGSVAAAWQAAAQGMTFHPFVAGHSSISVGPTPARSPVRTPARKSIVGSPRKSPVIPISQGSTYADIMARTQSVISSAHAPPKPEGCPVPQNSPTKSPTMVAPPARQRLDDSRWSAQSQRPQKLEDSRWSGKLATASDPYFQKPSNPPQPSKQPIPTPSTTTPTETTSSKVPSPDLDPTPPASTAPDTPASITTSTAAEIEEYFELLEAEQEEENRYELDPARLKRDLEINERVNQSLALAEEEILVREILAPRSAPERKMVQFVDRPPSPGTEEGVEYAELKVVMKRVYVWDSFRDFVTVTSVTGFEEYIPQPRSMGGPETERLRTKIRTVDTKSDLPTTSDLKTPENLKVETAPPSTSTVSEIKVTQPGPPPAASSPAPIQEPKPTETSPPKPSISTLSPQVVLPPVLPTFPAAADMTDNKATMQPTPVIKHGKVASRQTNILTTEAAAPTVYLGKKFPVDHLKSIKPAQGVENTWDLRSAPLVKVDMEKSSDLRGDQDEFLLGLDDSKKVEEKTTSKKVVVVEEAKEVKEDLESQPVAARPISPPTIPTVIEEPAQSAPTPAALLVDVSNPVSQVSTAPAVVETVKPSLPSSPPTRTGMPIPVPAVAVAKPALKSPKKPAIAPKPPGLSKPAKKAAVISPLVGGLVDPFLAALQPEQKRQTPTRPKTPSVSSDSANTTPEKSEIATAAEKSIKIEAPTLTAVKEPSSLTSLSSSWTLVEKAKKEFAGLATQPSARKSWFGVPTSMITSTPAATPAPTPTTTPILQPSRPSLPPATSSTPTLTDPSTSKPTFTQGRKLFTFELKVGQSTVTTPVHENDDPRGVAETFAREHDLEARLPGGRGTVEKIVQYFEAQFIERKEQREKRRAERREKLIKQQQQQGANEEKSLV